MDPAFGSASAGDRSVVLCSDSERTVEDRSVRPGRLIEALQVPPRAVYPFRVFSANADRIGQTRRTSSRAVFAPADFFGFDLPASTAVDAANTSRSAASQCWSAWPCMQPWAVQIP